MTELVEQPQVVGCAGPLHVEWADEVACTGTLTCLSCKYRQPVGGWCDLTHWDCRIVGAGQRDA